MLSTCSKKELEGIHNDVLTSDLWKEYEIVEEKLTSLNLTGKNNTFHTTLIGIREETDVPIYVDM